MYCERCGAPLQPDQKFCGNCSMPIVGAAAYGGGRVGRHLHLLAILWLVYGAFELVGAGIIMLVANTIFGGFMPLGPPRPVPLFIHPLLMGVAWFVLAKAAAGIASGVGLLQRASWARILTIVVGLLSLLNMPFGTGLGIYSLWVLLSPNSDREYEAMARA